MVLYNYRTAQVMHQATSAWMCQADPERLVEALFLVREEGWKIEFAVESRWSIRVKRGNMTPAAELSFLDSDLLVSEPAEVFPSRAASLQQRENCRQIQ